MLRINAWTIENVFMGAPFPVAARLGVHAGGCGCLRYPRMPVAADEACRLASALGREETAANQFVIFVHSSGNGWPTLRPKSSAQNRMMSAIVKRSET